LVPSRNIPFSEKEPDKYRRKSPSKTVIVKPKVVKKEETKQKEPDPDIFSEQFFQTFYNDLTIKHPKNENKATKTRNMLRAKTTKTTKNRLSKH